jgi:tyrosinase
MANLGQFIGRSWQVRLTMNPTNNRMQRVARDLRRSLGADGALPSRDDVRGVLRSQTTYDVTPFNSSSPSGLRNPLEGWIGHSSIHNNVHLWVGGDMKMSSSQNDPVFFLHHCNVDRIWAAWQATHTEVSYVPDMSAPDTLRFHRIDDGLYSLYEERVTPRDMIDYESRYRYDSLTDLVDLVA